MHAIQYSSNHIVYLSVLVLPVAQVLTNADLAGR